MRIRGPSVHRPPFDASDLAHPARRRARDQSEIVNLRAQPMHNEVRSKTCVHHLGQKIILNMALKCCQVGDVGG
jgi:hypothetical protein